MHVRLLRRVGGGGSDWVAWRNIHQHLLPLLIHRELGHGNVQHMHEQRPIPAADVDRFSILHRNGWARAGQPAVRQLLEPIRTS